MHKSSNQLVLTVSCPSTRGIVAAIATYLTARGCNIIDSSQYDDLQSQQFFMRIGFISQHAIPLEVLKQDFQTIAEAFTMKYNFYDHAQRMNVILMVSRFGHCLNDLLYRWKIGALPINIVAVISNHFIHQKIVVNHDIPFHFIGVDQTNKHEAEQRLAHIIQSTATELVVLARYMQVLSDDLCQTMSGRIINIHHSFLPSFKGANPYKQAHERGVKLIGATAHYVTSDLDEGPIIEQDIASVTHSQSPEDYIAIGRDVESRVLARAVHAHIHHRCFINGKRTVVFPASPGSYASEVRG